MESVILTVFYIRFVPKPLDEPEDFALEDKLFDFDTNMSESQLDLEAETERIDKEDDRTTNHELIGKQIRGHYETGWHVGRIEYFNRSLEEFHVLFDDGSEDYIKETDIDGVEIILVKPDNTSKVSGCARKSDDNKKMADGED